MIVPERSNHAAFMEGFVAAAATGKVKRNVALRPPPLWDQIRPPCDSTMDLVIAQAHAAALWFRRKERINYLVGLAHPVDRSVSFIEISI